MPVQKKYAKPPVSSDYEDIEDPAVLALMLLSYFTACAADASTSGQPTRTISISAETARSLGRRGFYVGTVSHDVWKVPQTFWFAVDTAGNAFEYAEEGHATRLTSRVLSLKTPDELKQMLSTCNPFPGE